MTEKRKEPPTFHFLPKTRAKRLKKSWIQDHKTRSKWRLQKRREGLTNQTIDDVPRDRKEDVDAHSKLKTTPNRPDESTSPASSHDKQSMRNLRKIAYTSKPLRTQKTHSSSGGGMVAVGREAGQPNMKLRMNLLLEKIKRDFP